MRIERIYSREQGLFPVSRANEARHGQVEGITPVLEDDAVTFDPKEEKEGAAQQEKNKQGKKKGEEQAENEPAVSVIDLLA